MVGERTGLGPMVAIGQSIGQSYHVPEFSDWRVIRGWRDGRALGRNWLASDSAWSSDKPIMSSAWF